jgi:hypothetical protein
MVLVYRIHNPVDAWVLANHRVCCIDENYLKIFVGRILIDPIGIQNPKTSKLASSTLLSNRSQIALELQLCNTLVLGLSINNTLAHWSLSTPSSDTNTVHYIALQNNQPTTTA